MVLSLAAIHGVTMEGLEPNSLLRKQPGVLSTKVKDPKGTRKQSNKCNNIKTVALESREPKFVAMGTQRVLLLS